MSTKTRILFLLAIAVVGTTAFYTLGRPEWAPVAQAIPGCSASDLNGTFSFVIHGLGPDAEPFGAIGTFTSDGAGHLDGTRVSDDNGDYGSAHFTCTYAMSAACLFRGPCTDDEDPIAESQIDGALADGRREIELLVSGLPHGAPGAVVTGHARKQ